MGLLLALADRVPRGPEFVVEALDCARDRGGECARGNTVADVGEPLFDHARQCPNGGVLVCPGGDDRPRFKHVPAAFEACGGHDHQLIALDTR